MPKTNDTGVWYITVPYEILRDAFTIIFDELKKPSLKEFLENNAIKLYDPLINVEWEEAMEDILKEVRFTNTQPNLLE